MTASFLICLCCLCLVHLNNHMVAHEEHRFACPSCSYRAARKANLEAHISAQHGNNRKSYRCNEPCQYATGYAANLSKHQKLFCKYRRPNKHGNVSSVNQSAAATCTAAMTNMLPELESETTTDCNSVPGTSTASVTTASSWSVWSASAVNSFNISAE